MKKIISTLFFGILAVSTFAQNSITTLEYSIDNAPDFGFATTIVLEEPTNVLDYTLELSVESLADLDAGPHLIFFRVKDSDNNWSHIQKYLFYKLDESFSLMVGAEFFVNEDPGVGQAELQGNYVEFPDPVLNGVFPINIPSNLLENNEEEFSFNVIGIRLKNSNGEYSHTQYAQVYVYFNNFVVGEITDTDVTVCYNSVPNVMEVIAPAQVSSGDIIYQWYKKEGLQAASGSVSTWTPIGNANEMTLISTDPLVTSTTFACYATTFWGSGWMQGEVKYTVLPPSSFGSLVDSDEILMAPANPSLIEFEEIPTGSSGFYYKWHYKDGLVDIDPGDCSTAGWTLLPFTSTPFYEPPAGLMNDRTYACYIVPTGVVQCAFACWANNSRKIEVQPISVDEIFGSTMAIFPNPAFNELTVQKGLEQDINMTIFDGSGREVLSQSLVKNTEVINISQFASGVYTITLEHEGKVAQRNFVKE
ncbi:MAG: T9SS type A sorting domain-containing protein [Flavobacteriales bacterium]